MSATLSLKLSADSSDEEMEVDSKLNADSSDEDIVEKKEVFKEVLAADSSDDEGVVVKNANEDSSDEEAVVAKTVKRKPKALVDSDDSDKDEKDEDTKVNADSSDEETEVSTEKKKKKIKRPLDSDSDADADSEPTEKKEEKSNLDSSNPLKNKDLYDADSSDEELPDLKYTSQVRHSSDEDKGNYSDGQEESESLDDIKRKVLSKHNESKKEKKERKSKSNAMEEIRSESQRMVRESTIGLKYHRPKQRTLEEFLNRKKGTDDEYLNRILGEKRIRINRIDSDVDKLLIERKKKMEEFYKSDSDEDNDENVETNEDVAKDIEGDGGANVDDSVKASDSGILTGVETSDDSNPATDEQKSRPKTPEEGKDDKNLASKNESDSSDTKAIVDDIKGDIISEEKSPSEGESKDGPTVEKETLKESSVPDPDSLHLFLEPDTQEIEDDSIFENSQIVTEKKDVPAQAKSKLELLRSKFDVSNLEESLNFSPKIGFGDSYMTNNIFEEKKEKVKLSTGAEKLFKRLVSHSRNSKSNSNDDKLEKTVDLTIVKKVTNDEGKEVLEKETIVYNRSAEKKKNSVPIQSFLQMKEKLKKKMFEKRSAERSRRAEMMKMENEEGFDVDEEILDEEEIDEDADDEEEESEGESEPEEENDVPMIDKKRKSNAYLDEEAEESDEDDGEDDLHLQLDDDEDSLIEPVHKKSQFSKIKDPELLSESSTNSDIFKLDSNRSQVETPTLAMTRGGSTAPSSCVSNLSSSSSMGMAAILQSEPRWTPFQDRVDSTGREITSADNSMLDAASPTASQQARKKLGFEGLFDGTDPDVEDVDDVVGLCSGKFVSQVDRALSPATQATQHAKLQELALKSVESQDTVVFESDSRPGSSLSDRDKAVGGSLAVDTQDTVILTGNTDVKDNVSSAISRLDKLLGMDQDEKEEQGDDEARIAMSDDEAARPAPGFMEHHSGFISSDDEEPEGKKRNKKRKRRILSDSEEDDEESNGAREMSEEDNSEDKIDKDVEYDSDENVIQKKETFAGLFSKKGMLKHFVEKEADLSGSDGSEDEDEKGLDVLEMEEGDLDDIDEDDVRDQVGRIHNKQILDEDQAEIKLFQERFLEDGEDHDDQKRERQFKWKGKDDEIELELRKSDDEDETETQREQDEKSRKERLEREAWLLQNQEKVQEEVIDKEEKDSQFFQVAEKVMTRMASREEKNMEEKEESGVFKSPKTKAGPLQPLQLSVNSKVRGSFLARGEKSLKILAEKNKLGGDTRTGTGAKSNRNFVFARISPVKQLPEEPVSPSEEKKKSKKSQNVKPPPAKRVKLDRTLDPSKKGTLFNLL